MLVKFLPDFRLEHLEVVGEYVVEIAGNRDLLVAQHVDDTLDLLVVFGPDITLSTIPCFQVAAPDKQFLVT